MEIIIYGTVKSNPVSYNQRYGIVFFLCKIENKIQPIYISENKLIDIKLRPGKMVLLKVFKKDNKFFAKTIKLI